jgi:hypothetical protein
VEQKPQVLTHVIEGYVIEESSHPFPINGEGLSEPGSMPQVEERRVSNENSAVTLNEMGVTNNAVPPPAPVNNHSQAPLPVKRPSEATTCEICTKTPKGKNKWKVKNGKRFCSSTCVKKFQADSKRLGIFNRVTSNLNQDYDFEANHENPASVSSIETDLQSEESDLHEERKRMKLAKKPTTLEPVPVNNTHHEEEPCTSRTETVREEVNVNGSPAAVPPSKGMAQSIPDPSPSPSPSANPETESSTNGSSIAGVYIPAGGKNPLKWSVPDVHDFVWNLPGCQEYAEEFRSQEIDGQALMLLKEDHLMSAMGMKLGPALKVCSKINALKEKAESGKPT